MKGQAALAGLLALVTLLSTACERDALNGVITQRTVINSHVFSITVLDESSRTYHDLFLNDRYLPFCRVGATYPACFDEGNK